MVQNWGERVLWAVLGFWRPEVEGLRDQTSGPYGTETMGPADKTGRSLGCNLGAKGPRFRNGLGHRCLKG